MAFGIFYRFGMFEPRKIWQPWTEEEMKIELG
jgi:hypothetical protein